MVFFLKQLDGHQVCLSLPPGYTAGSLRLEYCSKCGINEKDVYLVGNGRIIHDESFLRDEATYSVALRLVGGKGGFGSMLRAIGAQIEKTTNREACRDLSGRRMRDVNNEKKLREWVGKKADREREREERRQQRLERRRAVPKHNFNDPVYELQKSKVSDDLDEALQEGLKSAAGTSSQEQSRKRKSDDGGAHSSKKSREWIGMDIDPDALSDSDEDESESESGPSGDDNSSESVPEMKVTHNDEQNDSVVELIDSKPKDEVSVKCPENPVDAGTEKTNSTKEKLEEKSETKPEESCQPSNESKDIQDIDLADHSSADDLESLGLENLKAALMARGLKCGGSLTERAERLFSVKGLTPEQYPTALLSKGGKGKGKGKGKK